MMKNILEKQTPPVMSANCNQSVCQMLYYEKNETEYRKKE